MAVQSVTLSGSALTGHIMNQQQRALVAQLPQTVMLGRKRPEAMPQCFQMKSYFDKSRLLTPLPTSINRRDKAAASIAHIFLNDRLGCCVISGKGHLLGLLSANDSDSPGIVIPTDAEILSQYHGICGPGDNGCNITDVLDVMRAKGFLAAGQYYKIDGYVGVDWTNQDESMMTQYLFGASTIGINLPSDWTRSNIWDVTNSGIVGGHDVTPIDYDEKGVYVSSWGRIYLITWAAWKSRRWLSEYYAILMALWYGSDKIAPCGFDATTLQADLVKLGNGIMPDITPPPPPPPPGPPLDFQSMRLMSAMKMGTYENGKIILASDMPSGDYSLLLQGSGPPPIVP